MALQVFGFQHLVAVSDGGAAIEDKAMQHRLSVEKVRELFVTNLKQSWAIANQGPFQPFWDCACNLQYLAVHLLLEGRMQHLSYP
eukprot:773446-Rhodomonas_salina.2